MWWLYDGVRGVSGVSDAHRVTVAALKEVKVGRTCVKCSCSCFVIYIDKEFLFNLLKRFVCIYKQMKNNLCHTSEVLLQVKHIVLGSASTLNVCNHL